LASRERDSISSLPDLIWQSVGQGRLLCFAACLQLPHFSMDRRVKPGGDERSERSVEQTTRSFDMPVKRDKPPGASNYDKRRSFEEGRALVDAAHVATHRLYCDALAFWRRCPKRPCKRHRRCVGEPTGCLMRGLPLVPEGERLRAQSEVIAGGPRRIPPATHIEWQVRRTALAAVVSWGFG
jgi:hypothetical protein